MSALELAATIPTPVDFDGTLAGTCLVREPDGWAVAFMLDGGRRKEPTAPRFPTTATGRRQASALARVLDERGRR